MTKPRSNLACRNPPTFAASKPEKKNKRHEARTDTVTRRARPARPPARRAPAVEGEASRRPGCGRCAASAAGRRAAVLRGGRACERASDSGWSACSGYGPSGLRSLRAQPAVLIESPPPAQAEGRDASCRPLVAPAAGGRGARRVRQSALSDATLRSRRLHPRRRKKESGATHASGPPSGLPSRPST